CNPKLASLITSRIGPKWVTELERLQDLEAFARDPEFLAQLRAIKFANKQALAKLIKSELELDVDPRSIFDVLIKRLHEYKRQLLCAVHIVALYLRCKRGEQVQPRTFIFGAKAAPGYKQAKLIIRLIHAIASVVNSDRNVPHLNVVFLPNYRVSLAEKIIPAADVSEQISTAGMEASGTGNMKLAMNGALTIGTLDGANIEIREAVGPDNFFLFGMTADEVLAKRKAGILGRASYEEDAELAEAIDFIASGFFSPDEPNLFRPLVDELLGPDRYMVTSDFRSYADTQSTVAQAFADEEAWSAKAALNIARVGGFSCDRTVREYAKEIWNISAVPIELVPVVGGGE
ncbi:MAG TPA: glycogen/starch/alpha-glucan phosphorylase, partial [Polyangium sp.]|nr:glycogen/starch/alpha-glucan phosphorylase [Polyangium sp.]